MKRKFSAKEDTIIQSCVEEFGNHRWTEVAKKLVGRTPRQCRERYKNYLSPTAINKEWTEIEEKILMMKYDELGPKWSEIRKFLPNHTTVGIKNRYSKIRRMEIKANSMGTNLMQISQTMNGPLIYYQPAQNIQAQQNYIFFVATPFYNPEYTKQ